MVFAAGIGNYSSHCFTWSICFLQSTLILCAGSVIHATGEQDIRRMGVCLSSPYNLYYNALASLSLIGFLS